MWLDRIFHLAAEDEQWLAFQWQACTLRVGNSSQVVGAHLVQSADIRAVQCSRRTGLVFDAVAESLGQNLNGDRATPIAYRGLSTVCSKDAEDFVRSARRGPAPANYLGR